MKSCPYCNLVNPDAAGRCDCGWDFTTSSMQRSYLTPRDRALAKGATIGAVGGVGLLIVRLVLTAIGSVTHPSGRYTSMVILAIVIVISYAAYLWRRRKSRSED